VLPAAAELRQRKEIFRRLLESERRFKLITESASDIVLELDPQGVVSYVSPSVTEITGFTPEQLIGRRPQELLSGPDARTFL
ncbi:PAS domain S-box protein, partial [Acinetobacter baumannii]